MTHRTNRIAALPAMMLAILLATMITVYGLGGCGDGGGSDVNVTWIDEYVTQHHPLGWLGGRAHPATRNVDFPDPEKPGRTIVSGGMVVTEVLPDAPLARAAIERGDVIVRVGETWLPNKEDPTLDLFRALESEISGGVASIDLGVLRDGALAVVAIEHGRTPLLEVGLPGPSERMDAMARSGLDWLAAAQEDDGGFDGGIPATGDVDAEVTVCAIAGLAFIAGGSAPEDGPHARALARCRAAVEAAVADESNLLHAGGAAWATIFLAGLAGPLDLGMAMGPGGLPPGATFSSGGSPPGGSVIEFEGRGSAPPMDLPEGAVIVGSRGGPPAPGAAPGGEGLEPPPMPEMPEELRKMIESGDAEVTFTAVGGPMPGMSSMPGSAPTMTSGGAAEAVEVDGPLWSLEELMMLAGPETTERLAPLGQAVARLVALQNEETGGWDDIDGVGYSERTLATNQALLALGLAQRAGAPVDEAVIRQGLAFVREHTNDGHVFAVDEAGFDRRREAGRSSGAAAALLALNCSDTDDFLKDLLGYSDRYGASIPGGGGGVPLHVLTTAIVRCRRGLDAWAVFFEEFRHLLVMMQDPDGGFAPLPVETDGLVPLDIACREAAARTAVWSLVIGLQSDHASVLAGHATNPLQTAMSSDGVRMAGGPVTMTRTMPGQIDEETLRRMLEAQGINIDDLKNQAGEGGSMMFEVEAGGG